MSRNKPPKNPYDCLGVSKDASPDDIRKAYRRLAMQHHPDKNPGSTASEEAFKDISEAYEILSDPDKKSQYDSGGMYNNVFGMPGVPFGVNFGGQGFSVRFGQRHTPSSIFKDIRMGLSLRLEDAYKGGGIKVSYHRLKFCQSCSGKGRDETKGIKQCELCGGSGWLIHRIMKCVTCSGSGKTSPSCWHCSGTGHFKEKRDTIANIQPRPKFGSVVTIAGEGNVTKDGKPGDLILQVSFVPEDEAAKVAVERDGTIHHWLYVPWGLVLEEKDIKFSLFKGSEMLSIHLISSRENGAEYVIPSKGWDATKPLVTKVFFDLPANMKEEDRMGISSILKRYDSSKRDQLQFDRP